jgi:hypothetical protein
VKTKTHLQFRLQVWDANSDDILERAIGTDDFAVAQSLIAPRSSAGQTRE